MGEEEAHRCSSGNGGEGEIENKIISNFDGEEAGKQESEEANISVMLGR